MLNQGLATMAVGMGTVFSFLIVLWAVVSFLGVVVGYLNKIFPVEVQPATVAAKKLSGDVEVAIAIAAAKLRK